MATFLHWWTTSEFPVTDTELFQQLIEAVEPEGHLSINPNNDLCRVFCYGSDQGPFFLDPDEEFDADLLAKVGLDAAEYPSLIEVIQAMLPDEGQAVNLRYCETVNGAPVAASIWIFDKQNKLEQSFSDAYSAAREKGINTESII